MRDFDPLLVNITCFCLADITFLAFLCPRLERSVLTHQKECVGRSNIKHQFQCCKVTICNPQIILVDKRLDQRKQRSLLCVSVFAGNDVGDHSIMRIKHCKREARQWCGLMRSCLFEPMFGATEVIAVDDTHTVSRQRLRNLASHDSLERSELSNAMPDEFGGDIRFETVELVVHGLDGNVDIVLMALDGMVNGR